MTSRARLDIDKIEAMTMVRGLLRTYRSCPTQLLKLVDDKQQAVRLADQAAAEAKRKLASDEQRKRRRQQN